MGANDSLYDENTRLREGLTAREARIAELEAEVAGEKHWRGINEQVLEDVKVALRRPGTDLSYIEWARICRDAYDQLAARPTADEVCEAVGRRLNPFQSVAAKSACGAIRDIFAKAAESKPAIPFKPGSGLQAGLESEDAP